jgi:hypothetical protein
VGQLQEADSLEGPWVGVAFEDAGPVSVDVTKGSQKFYRSRSF